MTNVAAIKTSTYNGWSNRETWLASLWLNSDGSITVLSEAVRSSDELYQQAHYLEDALRDQLEDEAGEASLWSDLLSTAFNCINWLEVVDDNL